jgi:Tol biopolymer transport system component
MRKSFGMRNHFFVCCMILSGTCFAQVIWKEIPTSPAVFEVSTDLQERDMAISPDGTEMFYTVQGNQHTYSVILYRKREKGKWSMPEVASFSGKFSDLEPAFTTDGKKIFFSSNRPTEGNDIKDYDIWFVERKGNSWSSPVNAGPMINTAANEFYPSLSQTGNLYFTAEYEKGVGKEDIYVSTMTNGEFVKSVPLDTAVNSKAWEFNAFVSPDEKFILFTAYGRPGDQGGGDLYISLKDQAGNWRQSQQLKIINSPKLDYCPFVSFDKKVLFFTSARHAIPKIFDQPLSYESLNKLSHSSGNGSENIYWISFQKVMESVK